MQRLQNRPQFQAVLAGPIVAKTVHFALHRNGLDAKAPPKSPDDAPPTAVLFGVEDVWIGAMAPKRWAKRAVTRNTIKRQIYSVSADFSGQLMVAAFVVRLRRDFDKKTFPSATSDPLRQAVRAEIQALMTAAIRLS